MARLQRCSIQLLAFIFAISVYALPSSTSQTAATTLTEPTIPTPDLLSGLNSLASEPLKALPQLQVGFQGVDFRCPGSAENPNLNCLSTQKCIFAHNPLLRVKGRIGCVDYSSGKADGTKFHMIDGCIAGSKAMKEENNNSILKCTKLSENNCATAVFQKYNATSYFCALTPFSTTITASLDSQSTILANAPDVTSLIPASILAQYTSNPTTATARIVATSTGSSSRSERESPNTTPKPGALLVSAYVAGAVGGLIFFISVAATIGCFVTRRKRRERINAHRMNMRTRRQQCVETPPPPYIEDEATDRGSNVYRGSYYFVTVADLLRPAPACIPRSSPPRGGNRGI